MTFGPTSVDVTRVTLPKDHCIQVPWNYVKVCGYSTDFLLSKTWTKGQWPQDDLWPQVCCGHMCDSTQDHSVQVPWKYVKVCGNSDPFFKNLNQRSLTPRWPLTPSLLGSHVWLYPRTIVSKSQMWPKVHFFTDQWQFEVIYKIFCHFGIFFWDLRSRVPALFYALEMIKVLACPIQNTFAKINDV